MEAETQNVVILGKGKDRMERSSAIFVLRITRYSSTGMWGVNNMLEYGAFWIVEDKNSAPIGLFRFFYVMTDEVEKYIDSIMLGVVSVHDLYNQRRVSGHDAMMFFRTFDIPYFKVYGNGVIKYVNRKVKEHWIMGDVENKADDKRIVLKRKKSVTEKEYDVTLRREIYGRLLIISVDTGLSVDGVASRLLEQALDILALED